MVPAPISSSLHFVIFPFMSQGHTIPLLYLSRILFDRGISVTIFTTPANYSSVRATVENDSISVIDIPFPENIPGVPPGVEIVDRLPSMSSFVHFVHATKQLQPAFEEAVQSLRPPVSCIISDGFLIWTQDSADKLCIPRLVFYGTNIFTFTMCKIMQDEKPHTAVDSDHKPFPIPSFPRFKLTTSDFDPPFSELEPSGPILEYALEQQRAIARSHGFIINSFWELESEFNEYWNQHYLPKAWCIGPFCLAKPPKAPQALEGKPAWLRWLDTKLAMGESVLYVAFGTQAEASTDQLREIGKGLERSQVSFLWVMKSKQAQLLGLEFEERVKGRGKVVREWVDQLDILRHESVVGFLSHCGWNSMVEAMVAGVPVLALPFMADQYLNARLAVEEVGMGLRVWPREKGTRGFVGWEEVAGKVKELMEGEEGKSAREKAKEVAEVALEAMEEGGSSFRALDLLIDHVCAKQIGCEEVVGKVKDLMEGEEGKAARERAKEAGEVAHEAVEEGGSSCRTLDLLIDHVCVKQIGREEVAGKVKELMEGEEGKTAREKAKEAGEVAREAVEESGRSGA